MSSMSSKAPSRSGQSGSRTHRLGPPVRSHAAAHRSARAVGRVRHAARRLGPRAFTSAPTTPPSISPASLTRRRNRPRGRRCEQGCVGGPPGPRSGSWMPRQRRRSRSARRPPARASLRLIDVEGYDLSACGGTHVARTGAIGIIAITGWERFKGGMRVGFVCGGRALGAHRRLRDVVTESARLTFHDAGRTARRHRAPAVRRQGCQAADQGSAIEAGRFTKPTASLRLPTTALSSRHSMAGTRWR